MRTRNLTSVLAITAVVMGLLVVQAPPPAAALSAGIEFSADDLPTWQTNGTVWAIDAAKGKVVAGGTFSQVRPPTGQAGTVRSQDALVILDGETGAPDQCQFSMSLSGGTPTVRAVQTSDDGSVVYIGGNFSNVGGVNVARIAALDVATCRVLPFRAPLPGSTVTALDVHENTLYAGGLFTSVGSARRLAFAAFDATSGALLDWVADAVRTRDDLPSAVGQARAVQASPDGTKVVVGGDLFEINGVYSHSIAMVTAATGPNGAGGEVVRTYPSGFIPNTSVTKTIVDGGDGRFYIGNEGTGGGVFDGKAAFSWETGDQIWRDTCLGAVQDLLVRGGTVYSASHHHNCAGINAFPDGIRRYFNAQSTETMEFFGWLPLGNDGIGEGIGPRALTVVTGRTTGKDYLWSGGEFTRINGSDQQGLTRFGPDDVGAPPVPVTTAQATSDGTIQVSFRTVVDPDDDRLTYSVYRTGTSGPIWQGPAKSLWWVRPQVTFVDSNVTPGTSYTYRVTASDGTNTSGLSAPVSARAIAPADDYGRAVRALQPEANWSGPVVGSWVVDTSAKTNRADAVNGLLMDGAASVAGDSAVPTDDSAFSFDGSNDYIRTDQLHPGPTTYTVSAWVKTTTTRGGKIIGFGNGQPNTGTNASRLSVSYDRHLYMTNAGRVIFGVYTAGAVTLTTPQSLNDGEWHYVVGTQGPAGMTLYVDGLPVASNGQTNAQNYWGIWRVGGDQLNGWPSRPTSNFLSGLIDEATVYPSALSRNDVARVYLASGRSLDTNPAPTDQYGAAVFDDDPDLYWRFDESTGQAKDSSLLGLRPGTYGLGTQPGVTGVISGNTAVRTPGTLTGIVSTTEALAPARVFTAEAWFKTTTTSGGKIFGFENMPTGNGTGYDKHLYMTDDGRLIWGSWIGSAAVVTSPAAYNDGAWHHVAGVIDDFGRKLFVDGEQVAQSNVVGAETGNGYWRVGGGNLGGWPDQPANGYFDGVIDEFAVYPQSMPLATVAAHHLLGVGDAAAPSAPTGLQASAGDDGITLTWTAAESGFGVDEYRIHRSAEAGFTPSAETLIGTSEQLSFLDETAAPGDAYYRVVAVGPGENAGPPSDEVHIVVPDTTPPSAPTGLTAVVDQDSVSLSWTASTDDVGVTGYQVHRGDAAGFTPSSTTLLGTTAETSYVDADRPASAGDFYRVIAVDAAGNASDPSEAAEATEPDTTPPSAVTGVSAEPGESGVNVSWQAAGDDVGVAAYRVFRGTTADFTVSASNQIAEVAGLSHLDAAPAGTWFYRVVAVDAAGNAGLASDAAQASVADVQAPSVPSGVGASVDGSSVMVSWSASSDDVGVVGYQVHRGSSAGFVVSAGSKVADVTSTSFTDAGRPAGTWYYRVVAVDAAGNESAASAEVSGTVAGSSEPVTVSVPVVEDAMVFGVAAGSNYGSDSQLSSRGGSSPIESFLSFDLPSAPSGMVLAGAELRLRTSTDPSASSGDAHAVHLMSGAWSESTVTWSTRPTAAGAVLGSLPAAPATNTAYAVSLSAGALGGVLGSTQTLRISSTGADNVRLWSSEASYAPYRPELVLTFIEGAGPEPDVQAPSVPSGVGASVDGSSVMVSWSASSDDVGVVGYQVHRGSSAGFVVSAGSKVADVTSTSFTDAGRPAGTWYYRVVAVDAAGNESAASAEVSGTVAGSSEPVTVSVPVVEDAMVFGVAAGSNYGSDSQLSSRGGSSPIESFLSFDLPSAPSGMVLAGAELRVRTSTDPSSSSGDAHAVHLMSGAWSESTVTWSTRPTAAGAVLGSLPAAPATNTAYAVSLSAGALGGVLGSTQTLRISSTGADNVRLWSSEASYAPYRPELVLTFTPAM
ncbi:LamG-like jellyroll fold domain-containing protein [Microbacterium sp. YJN-G]|uniref:LamG-like jellyroll fold domain-containing protein n=1 Tax=Microbacterium sp. YJN-G TaxID=2763257 RepID=UPI001878A6CC|nr:LamG-like jellyroll fold domain-containing protein [Microbacterium sp. YJN-G]